jgi:hydrogenase maturation protease
MHGILIIAYGNPLRCDDGLAWHVAEKLERQHWSSEIEIIACHQLTPELALPVSQSTGVLFIDAARVGVPGEIRAEPLQAQPVAPAFTHAVSPAALLNLARELYGKCAEGFTISVGGECFDHGETLSPKVEESVPRVVALVRAFSRRESFDMAGLDLLSETPIQASES